MMKILTIVVPTYNMQKYLKKNLDSFCIQDIMNDIEVLIVNDGSKDRSEEIAKEYAEKFGGTFRIINKKNGGHGSTINVGIKEAKGKYFKVVDADDWVEKEAFCNLVGFLKECELDIVYSNFYWAIDRKKTHLCQGTILEDDTESSQEKFTYKAEFSIPFKGVQYKKEYRFDDIANMLYIKMHNMTIRTQILVENNIMIDENCYYVDTEYILYPIPYVHTIVFIPDFVYMYRIGHSGQSVSIKSLQRNEVNYDKVLSSLLQFYKKANEKNLCTKEKLNYIASLIARVYAGKVKILLSYPLSKEKKNLIKDYDSHLKKGYIDIYSSNKNIALTMLRLTKYILYYPTVFALKIAKIVK